MSENINFSNNLTFTKVTDTDTSEVIFDITDANGLIVSVPAAGANPTMTVGGDLEVTGDLNVIGDTVVNADTKLSITDKNVLMNVPEEPVQPQGTSVLGDGGGVPVDAVETATVTDPGVNFTPSTVVPVVFELPPSGTQAEGTVTTDGSGNVSIGDPVNITVQGSGYVTAPTFTIGNASNIPPRPSVNADSSGTVVIRDWFDGSDAHAGIIWDESEFAWDLNSAIDQDIYLDNPAGPANNLSSNPRIRNVGAPVDGGDAVNYSTILNLALDDLSDVDAAGASNGEVLKYNGLDWVGGLLTIGDIDGINPPAVSSGYFYWDHTANGGSGEFQFIENIPASDITGLEAVATTGTLESLNNVVVAPTDGQVLTWDNDNTQWIATDKVQSGEIDTIQSPAVSPTASVSTTGTNVTVTADGQFTVAAGTLVNIDATTNLTVNSGATTTISGLNPIEISTGVSTDGELNAQGDFIITSTGGNVILHNVAYPAADGSTVNQSLLFYNSGTGEMEWGTLPTSSIQERIENSLGTTFVDTNNQSDIVVIQAPPLGDPSVVGGNITNQVGVIIEPGTDRVVEIPGSSTSIISSDAGMSIETTAGDISITPAGVVTIDGYIFPEDTATRDAGDFLIIDPADTINKQNLIFTPMTLDLNSDVTITGGINEFEVIIANNAGQFVNRRLQYSDIDPSGAPALNASILELNDVYDPTGMVPSVPDELKDKFLRWNPLGTEVIYEDVIPAANLDLIGTITNIEPSVTNTDSVGSASKKFSEVHATTVYGDTLVGSYTNAADSVLESMLSPAVRTKLNDPGNVGDSVLADDQTFTGQNTFAPTDPASGFVVSAVDGSILLSSNTGDVDITTTSGSINIDGYQRAFAQTITVGDVAGGTGTEVILLGAELPDNAIITSCRVLVTAAFDGATDPLLKIGSQAVDDELMTEDENDISMLGLDHVNSFYDAGTTAANKQLIATLTLDTATVGSARILIEYYVM